MNEYRYNAAEEFIDKQVNAGFADKTCFIDPNKSLTYAELQGYDVGGADGLAGFKTRRSIGDWQQKNGLKPTCFPDAGLVSRF